jgi:hypothetical protein
MNKASKNKRRENSHKNGGEYNGWQFARDFSNNFFGLINNGKIFVAGGLAIIGLMGLVIWRLPDTALADLSRQFLEALITKGFYIGFSILSNITWFWLLLRQRTIFQSEINRLSKIRGDLMHNENRVLIKNHRSSDDVQKEGYLLPKSSNEPNIKKTT